MTHPRASVIVTTYNWPDALRLCLASLIGQASRDFEVIVADDGSGPETAELVAKMRARAPMHFGHAWQEDLGFRRSAAINLAIGEARGEYLIFIDGDCIAQPDFVDRHLSLARPGCLVTGSRIMIRKALSESLLRQEALDFRDFLARAPAYRLRNQVSKLVSLFVRLPDSALRNYRRFTWHRIKGCNLACWRADALRVGGFDETLTGWGHEDTDFVFRLHELGIVRRSGALATEILHLWHPEADRSRSALNRRIVTERIAEGERRMARRGR